MNMGATSVTGVGQGASNKPTLTDLSVAAMGPQIISAGNFEITSDEESSPFAANATVVLPVALEGGEEEYVVMLTGINTGSVYVTQKTENDDGNMNGFVAGAESEGVVGYIVVKAGIKPSEVR